MFTSITCQNAFFSQKNLYENYDNIVLFPFLATTSRNTLGLVTGIVAVLACDSDIECELNGKCISNECKCYPGWHGPSCGTLKLKPAPIGTSATSYVLYPQNRPVPPHHEGGHQREREIAATMADSSILPPEAGVPITWGGTVIDDDQGKHHLFVDVCCYTPTTIMV